MSTGSPLTVASAPRPGSARNPSPAGSAPRSPPAPRMIARAIGCSDLASIEAATSRTSAGSTPSNPTVSTTSGRPSVKVPVLSNATTRTAAARSRWTPPLISTPRRAAPASAETIDTGVEMTSAHGHEITSRTSAR